MADDQVSLFVLNDSNQLSRFKSLQEYKHSLLGNQSTLLKGCFERDGRNGNIELKSFNVKITCLTANFEYSENVKFEDWASILNFMKAQIT